MSNLRYSDTFQKIELFKILSKCDLINNSRLKIKNKC